MATQPLFKMCPRCTLHNHPNIYICEACEYKFVPNFQQIQREQQSDDDHRLAQSMAQRIPLHSYAAAARSSNR